MTKQQLYSEEELLSLLGKDDLRAFDELYWKYQKAVYQNVFKLTRDSIISEDIVQEVFIGLWEKRNTIDTNRSVAGWLFVSSYNRSVNALKKILRESLALKEIEQTEADTEAETFEIQFSILEKAIAGLSAQKRRVFELCKLQGKSYEEAAAEMKISKHTVKEYLSDAVNFIKEFARRHPDLGMGITAIFITISFRSL